ncbi:MAG: aminotransferase class III-fold pyridoxal phosphate-dependent enzyme, partial [Yaniella sp.]|nr:aminotransferase class III-fold pyridoxal phosphate-dependent enzyme [Yaniella sp.]
RGRGAMMAVEMVDPETKEPLPKLVNDIAVEARKQGVITLTAGTYGNVLRFLPPVVIGEDLLQEGLSVITDILAEIK